MIRIALTTLALLAFATDSAHAAELQVAVAANFAPTLGKLAPAFAAATGHVLRMTSGATGKLHAQIAQGAPFDVLVAADTESPRQLIAGGHALAGTETAYAVGRLMLYSSQPQLVDAKGAVLARDTWRKLAVANPKIAPYGAAAAAALRKLGQWERLRPRLVMGENIAQAFQFVHSGAAELGFVARSQVVGQSGGSAWLVPADLHAPLLHEAVLLAHAMRQQPPKAQAAKAFLAWLSGPQALAAIVAAGYDPPARNKAAP